MKLIVGLGNPGPEYERTRHNAGWLALDRLQRRHAAGVYPRSKFGSMAIEASVFGERCLFVKPTGYMNRSGDPVAQWVRFYKVDPRVDLLVLVDDLALPAGSIRIRSSGGAGGHNGLADIERALGTVEYPRLRIGIDQRPPGADQAGYVLGRFTPEQLVRIEPALEKSADAAETFVREGVDAAMNAFNSTGGSAGSGGFGGGSGGGGGGGGGAVGAAGEGVGGGTHPGWGGSG